MKRSKMKERLAQTIGDYMWSDDADDLADHLLSFLEQQGMQPPPVCVIEKRTRLNPDTKEWETEKTGTLLYEWEPETPEQVLREANSEIGSKLSAILKELQKSED